MANLSLIQKIMILVAAVGAALILLFQRGIYSQGPLPTPVQSEQKPVVVSDEPQVVSTNPNPLDEAIIFPSQTVELTFNFPLENVGEFKHKLEPTVEYEIKLSDDRKTVKISPKKSFQLGTTYTLSIQANETKFDGKKRLPGDITYHFKTIEYKGI